MGWFTLACTRIMSPSECDMHYLLNVNKKTPWSESTSKLYRPSDRRLPAKLVPTFAHGCHVGQHDGSPRPYSRNSTPEPLHFLSSTPQLYSRGCWVDPVPDSLLFRKPGNAWNRTRASGSVATRPQRSALSITKLKMHANYLVVKLKAEEYFEDPGSAMRSILQWMLGTEVLAYLQCSHKIRYSRKIYIYRFE
jgi:hypothetical protein